MSSFFISRSTYKGNKRGPVLDARNIQGANQLEFQAGFERLSFFSDNVINEARAMNCVENFFALCFALNGVKDTRQAAAILFLYVKTHYSESVIGTVKNYVIESQLFTQRDFDSVSTSEPCSSHSYDADDEFEVQSGTEHWLNYLQDIKSNWKKVIRAPIFSKISNLLSMCAALGLCNLANFNVDVQGIRIFSIPAYKKHVNAVDFISACFDTVECFIDGGYECFKTGTLSPLLFGDNAAQEYERDFLRAKELSNSVKCGNLEKIHGMHDNDYGALLDSLIERTDRYLQEMPSSWERKIMTTRREQLASLRIDYVTYRVSGKQREAPYGLFIYGKPGVGKSYTMNVLTRVILTANSYCADDERICVINEADKFMSNIKSHVNAIMIDDMGNTKPDFVEKSPAQKVIELINNVQYYANMADIDQKGRVSLEPKVVTISSNLELSRIASVYSNDTMSIMRRVLHVRQHVRPEFSIDGTDIVDTAKVMKAFGDDPFPDIYTFEVQRATTSSGRTDLQYVRGLPQQCSFAELTKWIIEDSRTHFSHQAFLLNHNENMVSKLGVCSACKHPNKFCTCYHKDCDDVSVDMDVLNQFIDAEESDDISHMENQSGISGNEFMNNWRNFAHEQRTQPQADANMACDHQWVMRLFNHLPDCMFNHWVIQYIYFLLNLRSLSKRLYEERYIWYYIFILIGYCCFLNIFFGMCGFTIMIYIFLIECWKIHKQLCMARANEPGQMQNVIYVVRHDKRMRLLGSCALFALFYKILTYTYTAYKLSAQGNLSPETKEDVEKRDAEANPWVGTYVEKIPQTLKVDCDCEQLCSSGSRNLAFMRLPEHPDGVAVCDAFFVCSQKVMIPNHMVYDDEEIYAEFYGAKAFDGNLGIEVRKPICRVRLALSESEMVGEDFRVFHVHNGKTWANKLKFFPESTINRAACTLVHRDNMGDIVTQNVQAEYKSAMVIGGVTMPVYRYTTDVPTFKGMCMSMLVSDTKPSVILGFHLGGRNRVGAAGCVTRDSVQKAIDAIHGRNPHLLVPHSGGDFPKEVYGKEIITSLTVHQKSFFNHMPIDNCYDVFGSTFGRAKATSSKVIQTEISDTVAEICGVENQWGKPKFHRWKNYYVNLQKLAEPSNGFPADALAWACRDYIRPLISIIQRPMWKDDVKPATWMQTICGRDGVRFFQKMPPNTSIGFPLSGPKRDHMIALDPEQYPDFACPMDMEQEFKDEVERVKQVYLRGERAYPIFKAALKDEPTKLTKDKVRVFFAAPFALQALVRQYFLPVARFISMNPIMTECAVGINSLGPEWHELIEHITTFGFDRVLAGDYSDFDTKLPAQITSAAYQLFIDLAAATGNYTEDDLTIMRGLATDCTHPMIAYDGVLLMLAWLHASGINVTVYIGSLGNALQQRCGFYSAVREHDPDLFRDLASHKKGFRDFVKSVNYGDDMIGTVSEYVPYYNHITFRDYLGEHGMVFTMPDKKSIPTPYMHFSDTDFLKRKSKKVEGTDQWIGALDKNSIFKSLHTVLYSSAITMKDQCAQNIDGALREMWCHGKDDYEELRAQLRKVAERHDLIHRCLRLDVTWEQAFDEYHSRYFGDGEGPEPLPEPDLELEEQSAIENPKDYAVHKYEWRTQNVDTERQAHESDRPIVDLERYYVTRRSRGWRHLAGHHVGEKDKWLVIPRSKSNYIDLIQEMKVKPCFYEDNIYFQDQIVGDIDLGFLYKEDLYIFEIKRSPKQSPYANAQAKLMLFHMAQLNPGRRIHSFTLRGDIIKHVWSNCALTKRQRKMSIFQ